MPDTAERSQYRWTIRCMVNPWFSLGIHFDHRDPSIDLHLPGLMVRFGRLGPYTTITKCPCGRRDSWTWDWADGTPPKDIKEVIDAKV